MKITKERLIEIIKEELEEAWGRSYRISRMKDDEKESSDGRVFNFSQKPYEPPVRKKQDPPRPKERTPREKRYIDFLDDLRHGGGIKPEEQEFYDKVKADIIAKTKSKDERTRSDAEHQLRMLTKAGG
jgi:hypothetical protein